MNHCWLLKAPKALNCNFLSAVLRTYEASLFPHLICETCWPNVTPKSTQPSGHYNSFIKNVFDFSEVWFVWRGHWNSRYHSDAWSVLCTLRDLNDEVTNETIKLYPKSCCLLFTFILNRLWLIQRLVQCSVCCHLIVTICLSLSSFWIIPNSLGPCRHSF